MPLGLEVVAQGPSQGGLSRTGLSGDPDDGLRFNHVGKVRPPSGRSALAVACRNGAHRRGFPDLFFGLNLLLIR